MKDGYETYRNRSIIALVVGITLIVFLEINNIKIGSAEASSMIGVLIFLGPSAILGTIAKRKKKDDAWELYESDDSINEDPTLNNVKCSDCHKMINIYVTSCKHYGRKFTQDERVIRVEEYKKIYN